MSAGTLILPDRYDEPRLVGRGGMGEIYIARDRLLARTVAVKVLAERFAQEPELRERFHREALTAARLSGEAHVVTIFDVGEHRGRPYTVMEYLPGGTLGERAKRAPIRPEQALAWLTEVAAALDAAHAKGVVHRDVKPANLLFDAFGHLQVVDFGIARVMDETLGLTAPGTILGTAGYLAPEQALGQETTAASDRYALAVVAYELLTGGRPFERGSGSATAEAAAHIHDPVPPASERGVGLPVEADAVFARALAKGPEHRFPTAAAFVAALREALNGTPPPLQPPARRRAWGTLALAGATLVAAAGVTAAVVAYRESGDGPAAAPRLETVAEPTTVEEGAPARDQSESDTDSEDIGIERAASLNDEAFALMQEGRWEAALPLLERAAPALEGTYSDGFRYEAYAEYNLGRTLAELDRCDEAREHLERSKRLQGNREEIKAAKHLCAPGQRAKQAALRTGGGSTRRTRPI